ncbi:MAG: D-alanine--D-alanine ligase family protein [Ferrimicrobium sp.]|uniref:ATP-grasp domain-containing protein n=1 Tax=Ferrimicrobium acidiphilum TaxID=121039 RepID=A0ABV3Y554_9ACTN|nr:hypothetical protein [Ferrimicrobium sp.]
METMTAVLFGGPSPEHDISILTGLQAARALLSTQSGVVGIYWSKTGEFFRVPPTLEAPAFAQGVPAGAEPLMLVTGTKSGFGSLTSGLRPKLELLPIDVVVNCCHGGPGEDGSLQGAMDLAGIRYTGPSAATAALGMDKLSFGALASAAGLPALPRVVADGVIDFEGPYIVKPRFGGSSIGIEVVRDRATLLERVRSSVHLRAGAVVEPFREDLYDLQVAVRSYPELVLSAIERPMRTAGAASILSYSDKYQPGTGMASAPRELPAQIKPEVAEQIRHVAVKTANLIQSRGVARIDFLANDAGELYLNEVNTIPGSLSHYLFVDPRESLAEQLAKDIREARERSTYTPVTQGADGTVLQSAATIAQKLA